MEKNVYDDIDPEVYESRRGQDQKQEYLYEHWEPFVSDLIVKYSKGHIVLDLGCGTGKYSFEIAKHAKKVFALDSSERMLDYAKKKYPEMKFIYADATNTPLEDNSIDVVFSFGLLEYVKNKEKLIKEISRLLKHGGTAIVSSTNIYSIPCFFIAIYYKIIGKKRMTTEPSFGKMKKIFNALGFEIIDYKMDDGLFWLPCKLDKLFGKKTYLFIENFFKIFKRNPFSTVMFFIIKKLDY